jgi:hypothetical protein
MVVSTTAIWMHTVAVVAGSCSEREGFLHTVSDDFLR